MVELAVSADHDLGCLAKSHGGILNPPDRILSLFAASSTHDDENMHGHLIGADTGQQVWEALVS